LIFKVKPLFESMRAMIAALLSWLRRRVRSWLGREEPPDALEAPEPHPWEASYPKELDWRATIPLRPVTAILDREQLADDSTNGSSNQ
jgi:hypothetical protein